MKSNICFTRHFCLYRYDFVGNVKLSFDCAAANTLPDQFSSGFIGENKQKTQPFCPGKLANPPYIEPATEMKSVITKIHNRPVAFVIYL